MTIKHVAMLAEGSCGRVQKMAVAARAAGIDRVSLVTAHCEAPGHRKVLGYYDEIRHYPPSVFAAGGLGQQPGKNAVEIIRCHLRELQPDIIHVHNEPNWIVGAALVSKAAPVVFDVHDLDLVRYSHLDAQTEERTKSERDLVEQSHGVIVPCKGYADVLGRGKVIYSMTERRYVRMGKPDCKGLLLMGHVAVDAAHAPWLDYTDVARRFAAVGWPLFVQYGGKGGMTTVSSGATILQPCPYEDMMLRLGRFRWGLVSGGVPCAQWKVAMPNKLFEYLACGVVPVVMWADEAAEYVRKHGVGVVLNSPEEATSKLSNTAWQKCRTAIEKMQGSLCMESQAGKLMGVYREAVEKWSTNSTLGRQENSAATASAGDGPEQSTLAATAE